VLPEPVIFIVEDSHIAEIQTSNSALADELRAYFWNAPNGRRAGEFAIGTLEGLSGLTGNLLQDEKMPGLHVAFGNPYPQFTGADWASTIHADCVVSGSTVVVDGQTIMRDGLFTI
jgi:leucyl aminopeptidase (aminopeptidase T)